MSEVEFEETEDHVLKIKQGDRVFIFDFHEHISDMEPALYLSNEYGPVVIKGKVSLENFRDYLYKLLNRIQVSIDVN